jgi:hypothetical protein
VFGQHERRAATGLLAKRNKGGQAIGTGMHDVDIVSEIDTEWPENVQEHLGELQTVTKGRGEDGLQEFRTRDLLSEQLRQQTEGERDLRRRELAGKIPDCRAKRRSFGGVVRLAADQANEPA